MSTADHAPKRAGLRIDRWLWYARFFKSRGLAAESVKAGHVRLNGQRVKPARELKICDMLIIAKGDTQFEVQVDALPQRRGPAVEADRCYSETEQSIEQRQLRAEQRAKTRERHIPTQGRPDKRTRRLIRSQQWKE